jgi:hypothetical protein
MTQPESIGYVLPDIINNFGKELVLYPQGGAKTDSLIIIRTDHLKLPKK